MWLCVWLHVLRRGLALPSPMTPLARLPLYLRQTQSHIARAWSGGQYRSLKTVRPELVEGLSRASTSSARTEWDKANSIGGGSQRNARFATSSPEHPGRMAQVKGEAALSTRRRKTNLDAAGGHGAIRPGCSGERFSRTKSTGCSSLNCRHNRLRCFDKLSTG
jgi:hypothetical protein